MMTAGTCVEFSRSHLLAGIHSFRRHERECEDDFAGMLFSSTSDELICMLH